MDILKQQRGQQSNDAGMTLLEVMFSTIILGVVLVALGQGLTLGIKLNTESKMKVASLNACKHIIEDLKTKISQSQPVFDGTAPSNTTYYVDIDGNKTYSGTGVNRAESFNSFSAFRVNAVVSDYSGLTQTSGGITSVLVKVLSISVVDVQNIGRVGRESAMKVEIIRPSA